MPPLPARRPAEAAHLSTHLLFCEDMLIALPDGYRFADQRSIPLRALADESLILYPRRNGRALYNGIVGACQAIGFSPAVDQEAPQMASTVTLVAAGIGVSIVPAFMGHLRTPGVTCRRIKDSGPRTDMSLVHRNASAPAVTSAFCGMVLDRLPQDAAARRRQPKDGATIDDLLVPGDNRVLVPTAT